MPKDPTFEIPEDDYDWSDQFDMAIDFLRKYRWMGVCSGVEGLCLECHQSQGQGCANDCVLTKYLKRIGEDDA
jgi:hypothetical protein